MLEGKIQADIVKYLFGLGFFCHSVPNEQAHGNAVRTGQMISMGLYPGVADLVVWLGSGKVAYLEVKNEKGHQSLSQIKFQERCERNGYLYKVVRSVEDVRKFLKSVRAI